MSHPNLSQPSLIDRLYAAKVADLPLRNEQGTYDQHVPPDLSTSAAIGDYIQARTAAWSAHLQRLRQGSGPRALSNLNRTEMGKAGKVKTKR